MLPNLDIFRHDSYTYFYQLHKGDYLMKKILEEFKAFALKGNMIDMAVAVIIGGAFNGLITSLVENVVMPALSLILMPA